MKNCIIVFSLMIASLSFAQDSTWQSNSGSFTDSANWSPAAVPGIDDNTLFANGSYTVSFTRDETNRLATFTSTDSGDVAFDLNGRTWFLTNGLSCTSGALNNKVIINDGRLEAMGTGIDLSCFDDALPSYLTLGAGTGSELNKIRLNNAHLIVEGGTHVVNGEVWMPTSGSTGSNISSLTISNGTFVIRDKLWCGSGKTSTGMVNVAGGTMIVSNYFSIGDNQSTAVGMVNITGGELNTYGPNWLGNAYGCTGIMNISGGSFYCKNTFEVGHRRGTKGFVNISGGKFTANSQILVGNYNDSSSTEGTVTITGGELEIKSALNIAVGSNCVGQVLITGCSTSNLERIRVGQGGFGQGEFYLTNGLVTQTSDLEVGSALNANGLITIDGGVFSNKNNSAQIGISGTGRMIINGGKVYNHQAIRSGTASGGFGEIEINNGEISCNNFVIGYAAGATGTYTQADGTVETRGGDTLIGDLAGSHGEFAINGGSLDVTGGFYTGNHGTGILNINGGNSTFNSGFTVGHNDGGIGTANITDGVITFNNGLSLGKYNGSSGSLNISGGSVTNTSLAHIGENTGATGSLTVAGNGLYSSGRMYVGNYGTGTLNLNEGDTAFLDGFNIGANSTSTGFVTITGGTLTNRTDSFIGHSGVGHMTISGGTNYIASNLIIGNTKEGYLNITGGETYFTGSNFKTTLGVGSSGRIDMSGGYLNVDGYLDIGSKGSCILEMTGGEIETWTLRMMANGAVAGSPASKIIMNGGRLNVLNAQYLVDKAGATGEVHLVNGVLSMKTLQGWWGTLNAFFDGGTLEARVNNSTFIRNNEGETDLGHWLTARGLVIDSAGFSVGTALELPDATGENGKFTKKGLGKFTISGTTTFTGPIAVEVGEVELSGSGMVTLAGGVQIDGAALLDLHNRNQDFTMGAGSASRVDGTIEMASGKTLIFPATSSLSGTGTLERVTMQSGSTLVKNKLTGASNLSIANLTVNSGANIELTGYTATEFEEGITFINGTSLDLANAYGLNFTLNGVAYDYVALTATADGAGGYNISAHSFNPGTMIMVR
jgi:T5SS/PEP-CTERM-associated repeat protein